MIALRRNVLLFHQAALGDFVVTWPIALAAARLWPTKRIVYVTSPDRGRLAERAIGVEWRDVDSTHALYGDASSLPESARKLIAGATTIISFVSGGNDRWAENIRSIAPEADLHCIAARPTPENGHVMTWHASQLLTAPQLQAAVGQMIRHVAASGIGNHRQSPIVDVLLHPGSGGEHKRWPVERFVEVARRLRDAGKSVGFVIGEVERERLNTAHLRSIREVADVEEPADAVALFDRIRQARTYVGNDSGPTHLAAMIGVPTLGLFGAGDVTADAFAWRPVGPAVHLIAESSLAEVSVEAVMEGIDRLINSSSTAVAVHDQENDE